MKSKSLIFIVFTSLFSAVSFVLFLIEIPILPSLGHLKLDFSDVPAVIAGTVFNPAMGILVELIKNLLELFTKGFATQMGFGNIMNFIVGCAYLIPFSVIYRRMKKNGASHLKRMIISSVFALISIVVVGILSNYIFAPFYFKLFLNVTLSDSQLYSAVIGATVLNLIKGVLLSIITYPVLAFMFKNFSSLLKKQ
jgi:Predicted membrane protein